MQPSITHQRGACSSVHRSTLIRGGSRISLHTDRSKPALPTASHPLLPLFTHRLWCGRACVVCEHVCACGEVGWGVGSLCPWTMVALEVPQSLRRVQLTPSLPEPECYLLSCPPSVPPSLVALITLHVPCPFNLATKGRQAGEARD